jgi:AraC-like DNA-binding protein
LRRLADAAHLSPRQFSRAFQEETGQSPAKAIENLRIEVARLMLEDSRHSIDVIAREAGFGSRDRMREPLFVNSDKRRLRFGVTPTLPECLCCRFTSGKRRLARAGAHRLAFDPLRRPWRSRS